MVIIIIIIVSIMSIISIVVIVIIVIVVRGWRRQLLRGGALFEGLRHVIQHISIQLLAYYCILYMLQ